MIPILLNLYQNFSKKPFGLRYLSALIQTAHIGIAMVYIYIVLFSSDIYALFLVMVANFINGQAFSYYNGCVLSFYENINEDVNPVMSNTLCASFNTEEECAKNDNYEKFYINFILLLAFLKAASILLLKDFTGYVYTSQFKYTSKDLDLHSN
jgi:hypothetical protein